jgi:osmotically-inducible protein OsmY
LSARNIILSKTVPAARAGGEVIHVDPGEVNTQAQRAMAEKVASQVPNVKQVVNELQMKNQKATSSKGQ